MTTEGKKVFGSAALAALLLALLILLTGLISAKFQPQPVCCPSFFQDHEKAPIPAAPR